MGFGFDSPILDDAESWADASTAYQAGLVYARQWQTDARTALVDAGEYPPAYQNEEGHWSISYWSPGASKGLDLRLNGQLEPIGQTEWGAFYRETVQRVGEELLSSHGFSFVTELGQPGPDGLSFVFRRVSPGNSDSEFIDIQISTSVMLTPPPRRFTINLVRNTGERPLFGAFGGWEGRLGEFLPQPQPDRWWTFKDEAEYEVRLREALAGVIAYGLPVLAAHPSVSLEE